MNYTPIKKAMLAIGHTVSDGEQWLASDIAAFRDFAHFTLGVAHDKCHGILQYPEHFVGHWTRIHELAGSTPSAAPVIPTPVVAPIEPPTPVEIPVEVPVVTETPTPAVQEPIAEPALAPVEIPTEPDVISEPTPAAQPESSAEAPAPLNFNVFGNNKE